MAHRLEGNRAVGRRAGTTKQLQVGDRVTGSFQIGTDYAIGRVTGVNGSQVTVVWEMPVETTQDAATLRPLN